MDRDPWTAETVKAGLARFFHEIAGVGLTPPPTPSAPPSSPPEFKKFHPRRRRDTSS